MLRLVVFWHICINVRSTCLCSMLAAWAVFAMNDASFSYVAYKCVYILHICLSNMWHTFQIRWDILVVCEVDLAAGSVSAYLYKNVCSLCPCRILAV